MPPKRPAGLGASSKAKKNKQDEARNEEKSEVQPSVSAPGQEDDEDGDNWADLVELWEKCSISLQSGCFAL